MWSLLSWSSSSFCLHDNSGFFRCLWIGLWVGTTICSLQLDSLGLKHISKHLFLFLFHVFQNVTDDLWSQVCELVDCICKDPKLIFIFNWAFQNIYCYLDFKRIIIFFITLWIIRLISVFLDLFSKSKSKLIQTTITSLLSLLFIFHHLLTTVWFIVSMTTIASTSLSVLKFCNYIFFIIVVFWSWTWFIIRIVIIILLNLLSSFLCSLLLFFLPYTIKHPHDMDHQIWYSIRVLEYLWSIFSSHDIGQSDDETFLFVYWVVMAFHGNDISHYLFTDISHLHQFESCTWVVYHCRQEYWK